MVAYGRVPICRNEEIVNLFLLLSPSLGHSKIAENAVLFFDECFYPAILTVQAQVTEQSFPDTLSTTNVERLTATRRIFYPATV